MLPYFNGKNSYSYYSFNFIVVCGENVILDSFWFNRRVIMSTCQRTLLRQVLQQLDVALRGVNRLAQLQQTEH